MIQSHLLQILALVAMDPIATVNARDLRDAKAQVLRACRPWHGDPDGRKPSALATRSAPSRRRDIPDYTDEPGVDPARNTETLAELAVEVENWRWAGVPFWLRSGQSAGGTPERGADRVRTPFLGFR